MPKRNLFTVAVLICVSICPVYGGTKSRSHKAASKAAAPAKAAPRASATTRSARTAAPGPKRQAVASSRGGRRSYSSSRSVRASARGRRRSAPQETASAAPSSVPLRQVSHSTAQRGPSADRYREIQQALVQRGYLKSEPTGVWDSDSVQALKRFQLDQNLKGDGKLDSLSLIALGLGPKHEAEPAKPSGGGQGMMQ